MIRIAHEASTVRLDRGTTTLRLARDGQPVQIRTAPSSRVAINTQRGERGVPGERGERGAPGELIIGEEIPDLSLIFENQLI